MLVRGRRVSRALVLIHGDRHFLRGVAGRVDHAPCGCGVTDGSQVLASSGFLSDLREEPLSPVRIANFYWPKSMKTPRSIILCSALLILALTLVCCESGPETTTTTTRQTTVTAPPPTFTPMPTMGGTPGEAIDSSRPVFGRKHELTPFEIASVLVRFDHIASFIVNALFLIETVLSR